MKIDKIVDERVEYGLIVDRTSIGMGHFLALTTYSMEMAEMYLEGMAADFPVEIKQRKVITTGWEPVGP